MVKYDVIIVGAGPGGLKCAEILSQQHKRVLLLEKNEAIGPKVCAGGITRKSFKFLGLPKEIVGKDFDNIVFKNFSHQTKLFFGEKFIYTVDRKKLGEWQLEKLKNSSVEVRTKALVSEVTAEYVVLNDSEKVGYSFLVGADGSNSIVRRHLGLKTKNIGIGFQYLIPRQERYSDIELFFDSKLFNAWYSWIFPHADFVSVGYGCFPRVMSMQKARANFEKWAELMKIDLSIGKFEAHPINCDYQGYAFGNVFLVGDAAGLASGFTGEGIYQALVSGTDVAKKIINPKHKTMLIAEIIRERNLHHVMLAIVYLFGPLRDTIFWLVIMITKSKAVARFLLRILT
jgi:geranylgeranyl reductase